MFAFSYYTITSRRRLHCNLIISHLSGMEGQPRTGHLLPCLSIRSLVLIFPSSKYNNDVNQPVFRIPSNQAFACFASRRPFLSGILHDVHPCSTRFTGVRTQAGFPSLTAEGRVDPLTESQQIHQQSR